MTIDDFARKFAEKYNYTLGASNQMVREMFEFISDELTAGKNIAIRGFGTFCVERRKEHEVYDFKTGEMVMRPAKDYPKFEFSGTLKKRVAEHSK